LVQFLREPPFEVTAEITRDATFNDLDVDSLGVMELVIWICEPLGIDPDDIETPHNLTVQALLDQVEKLSPDGTK